MAVEKPQDSVLSLGNSGTEFRNRIVTLARSLDGLSGDPSSDSYPNYLSLIAPGETPTRQAEMARMSGCALVVRGLWRLLGIQHPRLGPPYVTGRAVSDLYAIAIDAGAYRPGFGRPEPGDVVHVGGNATGPEHVFTALEVTDDPYSERETYLVTGLDGGQLDDDRHQLVLQLDHVLELGVDRVEGDGHPYRRTVRGIIDVEKVFERFGQM